MQLFVGTYGFPVNATQIGATIETLINEGGQFYAQKKSLHVSGYLSVNGQTDSALQEAALRTALAIPYQNILFKNDDGTLSALGLVNLGSNTGVRITHVDFPTTQGPEIATIRSFAFTAEAEYPYPLSAALLLSFTETLTFEGGLPIFAHRLAIDGPNQKQLVWPQDTFRATQAGTIVGYRAPPNVLVYAPPKWPYALKQAARISTTSPKRKGFGYEGYGVTYSYEFEDVAPLVGLPTLWVI